VLEELRARDIIEAKLHSSVSNSETVNIGETWLKSHTSRKLHAGYSG